jgi:hypothetical protein
MPSAPRSRPLSNPWQTFADEPPHRGASTYAHISGKPARHERRKPEPPHSKPVATCGSEALCRRWLDSLYTLILLSLDVLDLIFMTHDTKRIPASRGVFRRSLGRSRGGVAMGFLQPNMPVVDLATWRMLPRSERIRPIAAHLAANGFGRTRRHAPPVQR